MQRIFKDKCFLKLISIQVGKDYYEQCFLRRMFYVKICVHVNIEIEESLFGIKNTTVKPAKVLTIIKYTYIVKNRKNIIKHGVCEPRIFSDSWSIYLILNDEGTSTLLSTTRRSSDRGPLRLIPLA